MRHAFQRLNQGKTAVPKWNKSNGTSPKDSIEPLKCHSTELKGSRVKGWDAAKGREVEMMNVEVVVVVQAAALFG